MNAILLGIMFAWNFELVSNASEAGMISSGSFVCRAWSGISDASSASRPARNCAVSSCLLNGRSSGEKCSERGISRVIAVRMPILAVGEDELNLGVALRNGQSFAGRRNRSSLGAFSASCEIACGVFADTTRTIFSTRYSSRHPHLPYWRKMDVHKWSRSLGDSQEVQLL